MNLSRALSALLIAVYAVFTVGTVAAQNVNGVVSAPFAISTSQGSSPVLNLSGQSFCSVVVYNVGGGFTGAPQTASDGPTSPAIWSTATNINAGSINASGSFSGNVGLVGPTNFRFVLSALTSGTVSGVISCSPSNGAVAITSMPPVSVVISPIPLPVVIATPLTITVNTPAPQPTVAVYLLPAALLACPSTAPAAVNSTYLATCDSAGNQNVNVKSQGTPLPVASAFATVVATTGPLAVVAGAATVFSGFFTNSSAATIYCNLYNVAAASVTAGTTQPLLMIAVPAGQTMPFFTPPTQGLTFSTAVSSFCATALNGGTSVTASNVWESVFYR